MQSYLVTLDFHIAYGRCDPTPGKTPPGTPEQIAAADDRMSLALIEEAPGDDKIRIYHCEVLCEAETDDGLIEAVVANFSHLAGFEVVDSAVDRVKYPPAKSVSEGTIAVGAATKATRAAEPTKATGEHVVICHFRSVEAFFRLNNAFHAHFAEDGLFFNAPGKPGHYVAYVVMQAPMSDGLEETVEALLRDTFDANSEETAAHFTEVTTNLL